MRGVSVGIDKDGTLLAQVCCALFCCCCCLCHSPLTQPQIYAQASALDISPLKFLRQACSFWDLRQYQFRTMGASTFVIVIVFVLDLIAFGLGIGAEQRRATGTYKTDSTNDTQWCQYDSDIATGLAVGALLFLLTSQVLVLAATRCLCCGNSLKPGAARAFAVIFFILNWLSFLVAASCFLAGAVQNAKHIRYISSMLVNDQLTCSAIRKDTFAGGVAFTFFTFILSVSYYLCCTKAQGGSWKSQYNGRDTGVNMASYS